jgi:hypothetical protein
VFNTVSDEPITCASYGLPFSAVACAMRSRNRRQEERRAGIRCPVLVQRANALRLN